MYIALLRSFEVLYIEPNDGPDGSKCVAYMKYTVVSDTICLFIEY